MEWVINLKLKKNSLIVRIWKYLIIFSITILLFLWLFQVIFLDKYYEWYKTNSIKRIADNILINYEERNDEFLNTLEDISLTEGVCIEISSSNNDLHYSSNMNRSCFTDKRNQNLVKAKKDFIASNDESIIFKVVSVNDVNSLVYGLKLDDNNYIFLNTLLDPIDSTITILSNQLMIVTFVVIAFSIIIAYFISNRLSKPITSLNDSAKAFASGDYNTLFPNTDIAEINELADSLNYAKNELAKTDELRKDLLANVSHDLKTPLTMIKAYAEMIRDITYKDKKKREENLNVIIEEVDRLNLLVSDILDLSSVQSKVAEIHLEDFDLIALIQSIIHRFNIYNLTEQFTFDFEYDTDNIVIRADRKKIEQVIYNLVSNAINYSKDEKIVIIKVLTVNNKIRVEITDKGKGIAEDEIKYIWNKYYKVDKQYKRNMVGTGLGLSIVKSILELHNFEYGVLSKKNKGTTFYFEIRKD